MWPFSLFNKPKKELIAPGFIDWHCHILPGVDDGVQQMSEALEILDIYERMGISEVWCTPHIMEDIPNTTAHLKEVFAELRSAYKGSVQLHLSSENMLDNLFEERLESNDLLPLGEEGDRLLVETSYFNPPIGLYDTLERIKGKGYTPVLAHPERYLYMRNEDYRRLKSAGVMFQLNVTSLAGVYGKHIREKAERLKRKGLYDCEGTDVHSCKIVKNYL